MKLLVMLLGLGMVPTVSWAQRASTPAPALIEKHRLGNVVIGAWAEDVYEGLSPERRRLVNLRQEGQLSPALELTIDGASQPFSVVVELGCQQGLVVSRIFIKDPAFRTAKGVGVGSTVRELRSAYALRSFSTEEGSAGVVVDADGRAPVHAVLCRFNRLRAVAQRPDDRPARRPHPSPREDYAPQTLAAGDVDTGPSRACCTDRAAR